MVRFRKPEEIVEAVQFNGDWTELANDLGWTVDVLMRRWPKADMDIDGTIYSSGWPGREGRPLRSVPINKGDWVILRNGEISSFATDGWFDGWERE